MKIHHLNCVTIDSPFGPAIGHCMLLNENGRLILIDAGIGINETKNPNALLGKELVEITGYIFDENITAVKQIEKLGYKPDQVENIICSHLDPDHIGGLIDFPNAKIHTSLEEYESFKSGHPRYITRQLSHDPEMQLYKNNDSELFGLPARKLNLGFKTLFYLIPLFGHTNGHCGIAFIENGKWTFYIGDAYYYRAELTNKNHPVGQLATIAAVDNELRKESLNKVLEIVKKYGDKIQYFGYHDPSEFEQIG
ncbi:MBL fold metallo-hydrolase [Fulvivirga lutea]|uniref:MBL fold metallo-hydrolase n=1 Tax=Fulvivirga lutea TaxID=2810512 RepID=A0A974WJ31_9BACT|nr:MBL fold metallo-hydrolase [Fulvivirga lutea]QSE98693.1 MBL fold metallo-hydrolase [Fulvivirga lutea]